MTRRKSHLDLFMYVYTHTYFNRNSSLSIHHNQKEKMNERGRFIQIDANKKLLNPPADQQ